MIEKSHITESQFAKCCTFSSRDILSLKLSVLKVVLMQEDKIYRDDEKWKYIALIAIDTTDKKIVK